MEGWHLGLPLVLGSVCVILGHVVAFRPRPQTWSSITETAGKHCPWLVSVGRIWQVDTHMAICDVTVSVRRGLVWWACRKGEEAGQDRALLPAFCSQGNQHMLPSGQSPVLGTSRRPDRLGPYPTLWEFPWNAREGHHSPTSAIVAYKPQPGSTGLASLEGHQVCSDGDS